MGRDFKLLETIIAIFLVTSRVSIVLGMTNKITSSVIVTKSSTPSWYNQGYCIDGNMNTECSLSGSRNAGDFIQFDLSASELIQTIYMA